MNQELISTEFPLDLFQSKEVFNPLAGLEAGFLERHNYLRIPSDLESENQLLKNYIKDLITLVTQFEFTGQQVLETLTENFYLQSKAITSELQVKCLVEALDVQLQEIQKRDAVILKLIEELNEHNERINLLSDKGEEEGLPACKICFRNTNVVTKCDNHIDDDGVVGCAFCALTFRMERKMLTIRNQLKLCIEDLILLFRGVK